LKKYGKIERKKKVREKKYEKKKVREKKYGGEKVRKKKIYGKKNEKSTKKKSTGGIKRYVKITGEKKYMSLYHS
jgi:hypothetical protein